MPTPSSCTILLNQRAGALHFTPNSDQILQLAQEVGLEADVVTTRSPKHMRSILRRLVTDGCKKVAVVGGDGTIAPEAKVTDGQLDVVIVGDLKRSELLPYFRAVLNKRHLNLPKVTTLRAREVCIESRHRMYVHADDQIIGKTPVTITAEPKAIQVLVERL